MAPASSATPQSCKMETVLKLKPAAKQWSAQICQPNGKANGNYRGEREKQEL